MRIDEYFLPANVQPNNGSTTQGTTSTLSISRTGIQNTLTYNTTLNKKHALEILLGQSIDERNEFRYKFGSNGLSAGKCTDPQYGCYPYGSQQFKNHCSYFIAFRTCEL